MPVAHRRVFLGEGWTEAAIYDRDTLRAGHSLPGPAIVEQTDTTTPVLRGWTATVDTCGNLHLTRATP